MQRRTFQEVTIGGRIVFPERDRAEQRAHYPGVSNLRASRRRRVPIPSVDLCSACLARVDPRAALSCPRCGSLIRYAVECFASTLVHVEGCSDCQAALDALQWPLPDACMQAIISDARARIAGDAIIAGVLAEERRKLSERAGAGPS